MIECSNCILNSCDDPKLTLDINGKCNHCHYYDREYSRLVLTGNKAETALNSLLNEIETEGAGNKYNCLIGISGGIDSTYVAFLAKQYGLRPLCVHFDNGWNSELAVSNIANVIRILNFDLMTYVINWEEFKDLQLAYLHASVVDIEVLTDHAILGSIYKIAKNYNIKYILSGNNVVTEGVLPYHWIFNKKDQINIKAIHGEFGTLKLKNYPFLTDEIKKSINKGNIKSVDILNWVEYDKENIKEKMSTVLGWRDYGGKHYESVWTRFYQGYILPVKFGIDKRKAHLSSLICSGQITRTEALKEIKKPAYDVDLLNRDLEFVLKKLGLNRAQFDELMNMPIRSHYDFETEGGFWNSYPSLKFLRPAWRYCKKNKKSSEKKS